MIFSLFKKATVDTPLNPHGKPQKEKAPASGSSPAEIAANNLKALDMVRALEYAGQAYAKANPDNPMFVVYNKTVDTSECDPGSISQPGAKALSPADMTAIRRWVDGYDSWKSLFSKLDKAINYIAAEGYMGKELEDAVMGVFKENFRSVV